MRKKKVNEQPQKQTVDPPTEQVSGQDPDQSTEKGSWKRYFPGQLCAALIFVIFFGVIGCIGQVEGRSMYPTLHDGEFLIGIRASYVNNYEYGDIISFYDPEGSGKRFVKRVIGVGGDTISIKDSQLYINGILISEPYVLKKDFTGDLTVTVPEGELFVMGDNREISNDSRNFGPINESSVYCKYITYFGQVVKFD